MAATAEASKPRSRAARPKASASRARNTRASSTGSAPRSRSGGTRTVIALRRNSRSPRNAPSSASDSSARLVAETTRTSTWIGCRPPTRSTSWSCRKRSILACSAIGISPISSRNSVPPWACSILPWTVRTAPVKAPFSWPNSSLSSRFSGMAAQLIATKGLFARGPRSCSARASASLPVPLSPRMSTGAATAASRSIVRQIFSIPGSEVTMPGTAASRGRAAAASRRFSSSSSRRRSARPSRVRSTAGSTGFSWKS